MKILAFIAAALFVLVYFMTRPAIGGNGSVTVAWDPNTEPDLAGYKIYVGKTSRFANQIDVIRKWCDENEPKNEKCAEEWLEICKTEDKVCHSMLYGYDTVIGVGNVLEYTITGLEEGVTYFLAATAYDTDDNESAFSKELVHTHGYSKPKTASGFSHKPLNIRW
jgi:hypothetical protein